MKIRHLQKHLAPVGAFFCPPRCVLCGKLLESGDICPLCHTREQVFSHHSWKIPHVKDWMALWQYDGLVRASLIRFKFWRRSAYRTLYGRELAKKVGSSGREYDVLTWVPISWLRRKGRGYDQVELIAREMSGNLEVPLVKTLHKCRHNARQANIRSHADRVANVRGVYRAVAPEKVRGKRVLLIDDIVTTGATVSEAARVLKAAGAKEVYVACVATTTQG